MMKLLVLGATGGIGLEIVRQAVDRGHKVTAFVRALWGRAVGSDAQSWNAPRRYCLHRISVQGFDHSTYKSGRAVVFPEHCSGRDGDGIVYSEEWT